MEKQTVFRKVSVKDRLPIKTGKYLTNFGACIFSIHTNKWLFMLDDVTLLIDDWLEEIELPNIEEMKESLGNNGRYEEHRDIYDDGYEDGANDGYIQGFNEALNKLK